MTVRVPSAEDTIIVIKCSPSSIKFSFPDISIIAPSSFAIASISSFSKSLKLTSYSNLSGEKPFRSTSFIFKDCSANDVVSFSFVSIILYVFFVPSSAVTSAVIIFSPTTIFVFPSTFTVDFVSSASAITFISFSSYPFIFPVYCNTFALNTGDSSTFSILNVFKFVLFCIFFLVFSRLPNCLLHI